MLSGFIDFKIEQLSSVNNPNSIHGIYPYRGKISALDAIQVIRQMPSNSVLLDPFCGSGTIVYEGLNVGLKTFGVDSNPIAVVLAKGKVSMPIDQNETVSEVTKLINQAKCLNDYKSMPTTASRHFENTSADEISRIATLFSEMSDYVRACFLGTIALTARGCNHYKWTSSTVGKDIEPKRYIDFYQKFKQKVSKHYYPPKTFRSKIIEGDARKLSDFIEPDSVDFVFTSPPYFDCLDYTAYYAKIVYDILGYNRLEIRDNLIQKFSDYEEDMKVVLAELYKVCKKGARVIFVVGDKKVHGGLINGGEYFNSISPFRNVHFIERSYSKSSSQIFDTLNKTNRKEQIIIWEK